MRTKSRKNQSLGAVGLLALLALTTGCGAKELPAPSPDNRAPVSAAVVTAQMENWTEIGELTGTVEPLIRVSPGTKLMGRVALVAVQEGDRVAQGQLLARLDSKDLEAAVVQAEAGIKMAEAQQVNAAAMHRRMTVLERRGSATEKNLEDATAGLRMAEAGLEQTRANWAAAKVMLSYAEIKAPVSGYVTAKRIEAGDMAAPGMPLFTIEDLSQVKVRAEVPESAIVGLSKGTPARVRIDALNEEYSGTVDQLVPAGDPRSRTFEVKVGLLNPAGTIRSNMFARLLLPGSGRRALSVPRTAVVTRGELTGLFVLDQDGKARLRWIRLGREKQDRVEVISGLSAGERYLPEPPLGLVDGARVSAR